MFYLMKHNVENPYPECEKCRFIEDCPHPVVDFFGSPLHPEECQRSNTVSLKRRQGRKNTLPNDRPIT